MTVPEYSRVRANGIDFAFIERGSGPLVLCLHGFPDTAHSYDAVLPDLADAGFRVVAPFLRGYSPSSAPADGDFSVPALARDVIALIDAFGEKTAHVIGHDWGGFAAYTAANLAPERIGKVVCCSVPHMHAAPLSLAQLRKSWYVFFFQLPSWPERRVARNDFAFVDRLYRDWSPNWRTTAADLAPVKRSLAAPGGVRNALAYYRAMISGSTRAQREVMSRVTSVPALVFAGEVDGSVGLEQFRDTARCYSQLDELVSMPGVGHFPHRERPAAFAERTIAFLRKP